MKPSSPGFSGSKSYNATQHGCCCDGCGGFAGLRIGLGNGEAKENFSLDFFEILIHSVSAVKHAKVISRKIIKTFIDNFAK